MRLSLAAIAAVISAVALTAPARATMTASIVGNAPLTITSNGWSYTGLCPVNIVFSATINATVPSTFKYGFNRNTGLGPLTTAAASSGKPYTATDALSFNASGKYWEQLLVTAISPGQADIYVPDRSAANITIACGSGSTPGGKYGNVFNQKSTGGIADQFYLPAPTNVHVTTDPRECAAHLPPEAFLIAPVCGEVLAALGVEVVFSWQGSASHPDADGFHVYNAAGHTLDTRMSSSAGGKNTVLFKKPPIESGACYVIRAYKGSLESADSPQICLSGNATTRSDVLYAKQIHTHEYVRGGGTGAIDTIGSIDIDHPGRLEVGYDFLKIEHAIAGDTINNIYYRGGALFDIASLRANFIFKAVLNLRVIATDTNPRKSGRSEFPNTPSCLREIGEATSGWFNGSKIESAFSDGIDPTPATTVAVDVTPIVRRWAQGSPNLGFALRGPDEDLNSFKSEKCWSAFAAPTLSVTWN